VEVVGQAATPQQQPLVVLVVLVGVVVAVDQKPEVQHQQVRLVKVMLEAHQHLEMYLPQAVAEAEAAPEGLVALALLLVPLVREGMDLKARHMLLHLVVLAQVDHLQQDIFQAAVAVVGTKPHLMAVR
jgi:hypothetical protein